MTETLDKLLKEIVTMTLELNQLREENKRLKARPLDNKSKLTDREVSDIRAAFRGGMRQKDLADNYGVNPATISRTVRGFYH